MIGDVPDVTPVRALSDYLHWGMPGTIRTEDHAPELESGALLFLPDLSFTVRPAEAGLFRPSVARAKNVSFDPAAGAVRGAQVTNGEAECLLGFLRRFSDAAHALVLDLCPSYAPHVRRARASFRPSEIAGRQT